MLYGLTFFLSRWIDMPGRSLQFFMTPEEYWSTIWEVASDRFIVLDEDLKTRDGIPLARHSVPNDWKIGIYKLLSSSVQPSEFKAALREPAKYGVIALWPPATLNNALIAGGISVKNHWYEGETYYERKQSLDDYKLFHRPLNKLIVGWTEIIRDSDGSRSPHKGLRCSRGAVQWVEDGGVLKALAKDSENYLPLYDSLKKPRKSE